MKTTAVLAALALCACFTGAAHAKNYPCSQRKGGINHCAGGKFICNDGSTSAAKTPCSASQYGTVTRPAPGSGNGKK